MNERQSSPTPPLVASTTETAKPSNQELARFKFQAEYVLEMCATPTSRNDSRPFKAYAKNQAERVVDLVARVEALLAERDAAQAWLAERFDDEDDPREPGEVPLMELIERCFKWGDQAWATAGGELDRADKANSRLYEAVTRYEAAEGRVAVLEAALRRIADPLNHHYKPDYEPPEAIARAVLAGGDAAPQTDNLGGDEVASSGGGS